MMQPLSALARAIVVSLFFLTLSACSSGGSSGVPVDAGPAPGADVSEPEASGAPSDDPPASDISGGSSEPDESNTTSAPAGTQGYQRDLSVAACSTEDLNAWVDFDMRDYYIYYDQVPQLRLADYTDPAELARDLRVDPDVYTYMADAQEQDALRTEGLTFGYGFTTRDDPQGVYRFSRIRAGSPMHQAGIKRGDRFLEIDGVSLEGMSDAVFSGLMFNKGVEPVITVQTDGELQRSVKVVRGDYRWNTAPYATVFTMPDGQKIGYLLVEAFYQPTEQEMDEHLKWLLDRDINDFILDLRYNRGGSVRVSERLASQITGPTLSGEPFQIRRRNNKYSDLNYTSYITNELPSLSIPRLVILTTGSSASASETIINGLQPYLDVTVIGALTSGKPFTSRAIEYCGKSLNAMHSIRTNSVGVSILGGIQPDCAVQDQWSFETNDSRDALTSAGLAYLNQGECETQVAATSRSRSDASNKPLGIEPGSSLTDQPLSYEE